MPDVQEIVPVIATGLFAGAALGITAGDSVASEAADAQHAREHFKETYKRIAPVQASLAMLGAASSGWLAYQGGPTRKMNIAASALMAGMLPFTLLVIMPVNDKLLSEEKLSDGEMKSSLHKWNKLHLVRTVASIAAFGLATVSLAASHKTSDKAPVSY